MKKVVVHKFYAGDKYVWFAEWYEPFTVDQLREQAAEILAKGYGDVDIVTDSEGRLVRLKEEPA